MVDRRYDKWWSPRFLNTTSDHISDARGGHEAFALKDLKATTVATVLYEHIFTRYGAPRELISDRAAQFMSKLVQALCKMFAVKRHSTSSYHPQTNASCERMNSTIGQALRAYVKDDQSNWPSILPGILMAYRMTPAMDTGHALD